MKLRFIITSTLFFVFGSLTCVTAQNEARMIPAGKLYIIGGGQRPASMVQEIIQLANVHPTTDYGVILPMASSEPDSAFYYARQSFEREGFASWVNFNLQNRDEMTAAKLDSLRQAKLIYISGGDQNILMKIVKNSPLHQAIIDAYQNGALIAGTSAGAAVQSKKMITGNELKHPEYTGEYRSIEAENIEIGEGLGLLPTAIIDQHFIKRMRMNRLIAAAIENPDYLLIGIDESTAILVEGEIATVRGQSQVVVLQNRNKIKTEQNGLLGTTGLELGVYLPGQTFSVIPK